MVDDAEIQNIRVQELGETDRPCVLRGEWFDPMMSNDGTNAP